MKPRVPLWAKCALLGVLTEVLLGVLPFYVSVRYYISAEAMALPFSVLQFPGWLVAVLLMPLANGKYGEWVGFLMLLLVALTQICFYGWIWSIVLERAGAPTDCRCRDEAPSDTTD